MSAIAPPKRARQCKRRPKAPLVGRCGNGTQADWFMCLRRIGRRTNHAIAAAAAFMMLATMNTACQLPVAAASTLESGTSSDAVPLAVYSRPALAAANFEPNVSAQVEGNRL